MQAVNAHDVFLPSQEPFESPLDFDNIAVDLLGCAEQDRGFLLTLYQEIKQLSLHPLFPPLSPIDDPLPYEIFKLLWSHLKSDFFSFDL